MSSALGSSSKDVRACKMLDVSADSSQTVLPRSTLILLCHALSPMLSAGTKGITGTEAVWDHSSHTLWPPVEDKPQYALQEYLYQSFFEKLHTFKGRRKGDN